MKKLVKVSFMFALLVTCGLLAGKKAQAAAPDPQFTKESGIYSQSFTLKITAPSGEVHYTMDGSIPTSTSPVIAANGITVSNRNNAANVLSAIPKTMGANQYNPTEKVEKATVVRAVVINGAETSNVITKTYFVGNKIKEKYGNTPIVSIVTDQANLFDDTTGIYCLGDVFEQWKAENSSAQSIINNNQHWLIQGNYTQKGKNWERPAHLDFFESNGKLGFSQDMGIRVHGGASRAYNQKSFNIYAKKKYGKSTLEYNLFPSQKKQLDDKTAVTTFEKFMLRNGGNDTEYTKVQDVWIQDLVKSRNVPTQGNRMAILFIDGEYWGPYNMMEKYSDSYFESHYDVPKDNVVVIENGAVEEGVDEDVDLYNELIEFANNNDLTQEANFNEFCKKVDIDNMVDYFAIECFIANYDWPHNNLQMWRARTTSDAPYQDGKWRYILYDTEYSMGLYNSNNSSENTIKIAKNGRSGESGDPLFAAVYYNKTFQKKFIMAIMDIGNVLFDEDRAIDKLEYYSDLMRPLMSDYFKRFGINYMTTAPENPLSGIFDNNIGRMGNFVSTRSYKLAGLVKSAFGLKTPTTVTINTQAKSSGTITLNSVKPNMSSGVWSAQYFKEYPITLTANEVKNYKFTGWSVTGGAKVSTASANKINVILTSDECTIQANYKSTLPVVVKKPAKVKVRSLKRKGKTQAIFKFRKVSGSKGYQIIYSTNKKFKKGKKTMTTTKTTVRLKKLKRGKTYYVKVRAYKKSKGKKIYGSYSKVLRVKIKK